MLRSMVSAALLLAATPALAAVDTFVDFGGAIVGESTNINYLNWIELSSFNLEGFSKATRDEVTPARVTEPPKFTAITMSKTVDSTTGELMAAFLTGKARLFRDAIRLVLDLGGPTANADAFRLAEQARGRALLDLLRHEDPHESRGADRKLQREARRLEREIDGLASRMPSIERV